MVRLVFRVLLISIIIIGVFSCSDEAKKETIKIGNEQWAVSRSLNYLGKILLEKKGFDVEIVNKRIENIYRDLGHGRIDVFMDTWVEGHDIYIYEYEGMEDLGAIYKDCRLGLAVPSYFDIDSISDLKNDSASFDNVLYGVKKDAGVMISAMTALNIYDIHPEVINLEEDELVERLQMLTDKKENFVTGAWRPHWKIKRFDLKFLADTSNSFIEHDEIHKYTRSGFRKQYPVAANILSKVFFTDEQFSAYLLELKGAKDQKEIEARIQKWMEKNPDLVNEWLE